MTEATTSRPKLRVVVVGHVDHGKSTLVGRLLHETGALPDGKIEAIRAMSAKRGMPFEWAFAMDALQAERDQGITIDTAHIRFRTESRDYLLIDAPGHKEFLKNMVTGAAGADAALIIVDGVDGLQEQTHRHAYLAYLLGVRKVIGVVNKMDLCGYAQGRFEALSRALGDHLVAVGFERGDIAVLPISAREGDGIIRRSERMAWHDGPCLIEALDSLPAPHAPGDLPLRLPVQDVYKFDQRRIIAGRIESGTLHVGDTLLFSPSDRVARVASIEAWNVPGTLYAAGAGQSIGITLDEQIFVERGQVASHPAAPPMLTNVFRARLFWLGRPALRAGASLRMKLLTSQCDVTVERIERVIDPGTMTTTGGDAIERGGVGEVVLRARATISLDEFKRNAVCGRFVLSEGYNIVGGGVIDMRGYPDQRQAAPIKSRNISRVEHRVALSDRWHVNHHRSGILWMTGLSGAGKTTLAIELERLLFRKGYQVSVIDGDDVRHGLSADLGFAPEDRVENIRRAGEVAALMANAGLLVIAAFISPYRFDRDRIRASHPDLFHEIHVSAPVELCESRDVKGLYAKARAGLIPEFTGVSAPYEPPEQADLVIDTSVESIDESLARLMAYIEERFALKSREVTAKPRETIGGR